MKVNTERKSEKNGKSDLSDFLIQTKFFVDFFLSLVVLCHSSNSTPIL